MDGRPQTTGEGNNFESNKSTQRNSNEQSNWKGFKDHELKDSDNSRETIKILLTLGTGRRNQHRKVEF